jgi:hypothetical protein
VEGAGRVGAERGVRGGMGSGGVWRIVQVWMIVEAEWRRVQGQVVQGKVVQFKDAQVLTDVQVLQVLQVLQVPPLIIQSWGGGRAREVWRTGEVV